MAQIEHGHTWKQARKKYGVKYREQKSDEQEQK